MDPKSKKVLADQGSSVVQAAKWIGEAIFGDADDVLDDMAERSEEAQVRRRPKSPYPRASDPTPASKRRRARAAPPLEVIDVESFVEDEDDE